ncbi:uncharacterized protein Z520_00253 [Fonsecaea multimorphosa CBS 102226]|uniref:Uncharacterized protein n=1 Tax=Fonsecaea multimorphosa CBS 102226 TaxID=1442371 RepID=A0A0D2J2C7_9EURO|nr:uncharacterized protein Z520_00253 [Fonsecaea multimorphosa CBS 102226]KIY03562.1 hypothetical protein Z520_00253 [Fonsecaea multimorphosa CBS 102226]OAL32264.1 hypothetical protein AYO22_00286 [Fonsecaea multimorphosa]
MWNSLISVPLLAVIAWLFLQIAHVLYNVLLHPLRSYPGPLAAQASGWYKTYIELFLQRSWTDVLLHFSNPQAYHDIYNNVNRWDKDKGSYECFGEDHSSFGFLKYHDAKQRKDVLQPLFSRRNILQMQTLVRKNMDHLVERLSEDYAAGRSSDLFFAFRCFTMDTITSFCFAKSVNAIDVPGYNAPIIEAMEASGPAFIQFKHLPLFRKFVFSLPPNMAIKASPETAGLTRLQVILRNQVDEVTANPSILEEAPHQIIYHRLLDPEAHKGQPIPDKQSLYEEAQALMFGGGDTVGNTLMVGFNHILQPSNRDLYQSLRDEVRSVWPDLATPPRSFEAFEPLPLLTATIKESLRVAPGVVSPLLRVVPAKGATIASHRVPPGTVVGISSVFVHSSPTTFDNPKTFMPHRWLSTGRDHLESNLVAFSRGPRSCLGINLAWCELYVAFATMLRRFESLEIDADSPPADLRFRDSFLPNFYGQHHLKVRCKPATE